MTNSDDSKKRRIQAMPNGPYVVTDPPSLVNSKREVIETKPSTALCRCGRSENKPFCDGTLAEKLRIREPRAVFDPVWRNPVNPAQSLSLLDPAAI